jgi:hypothetical protein
VGLCKHNHSRKINLEDSYFSSIASAWKENSGTKERGFLQGVLFLCLSGRGLIQAQVESIMEFVMIHKITRLAQTYPTIWPSSSRGIFTIIRLSSVPYMNPEPLSETDGVHPCLQRLSGLLYVKWIYFRGNPSLPQSRPLSSRVQFHGRNVIELCCILGALFGPVLGSNSDSVALHSKCLSTVYTTLHKQHEGV